MFLSDYFVDSFHFLYYAMGYVNYIIPDFLHHISAEI